MIDLATIVNVLTRQLAAHGYHLTEDEARDVAAQVVMVVEAGPDPVATVTDKTWRPSDHLDTADLELDRMRAEGLL